jgi:hypothetical protein
MILGFLLNIDMGTASLNVSLLMLVLLLVAGTMWKLAVLLTFQRMILPISSELMIKAVESSEMSETQPNSTWCQHPKAVSTSIINHHKSLKSLYHYF